MDEKLRAHFRDAFSIVEVQPILKGWSSDSKYRAGRADGTHVLLKLSDAELFEAKRNEFELMQRVAALGVPMCQPVAFGRFGDAVYSVQSWIDGDEAEEAIPRLSQTQQYAYGLQAGEILRIIHTIPAPPGQPEWGPCFNRKIDRKIEDYWANGLRIEGDVQMLAYIEANRPLLAGRPQCYQHGDYHIGNMMIDRQGRLQIIDFNRSDFGDPWEEFNRIVWCAQRSPLFASGMVEGYFGGEPPELFWRLLALYIANNTLSSIYWAIPFGQGEIDVMRGQAQDVLRWYDYMRRVIPSWYIGNQHLQYVDGIPLRLKKPYDFSFLNRYGTVFEVFDAQDSGNICFGLCKGEKRYFVKFAGARTVAYDGEPAEAIGRLRAAEMVYRALAHPQLIRLVEFGEMGGGYALVFEWVDGACMGKMYPEARARFMAMPLETRGRVFLDILRFHADVAARGYVAVDFYDGSVLYDFAHQKTVICDIDFYVKTPYVNGMGRMWGSSRFMSPEEFKKGERIDEVTNVYTMGAMAFALFGDERDRRIEKWKLSDALFKVAQKAVQDARDGRQQSIKQLMDEWQAAWLARVSAEDGD